MSSLVNLCHINAPLWPKILQLYKSSIFKRNEKLDMMFTDSNKKSTRYNKNKYIPIYKIIPRVQKLFIYLFIFLNNMFSVGCYSGRCSAVEKSIAPKRSHTKNEKSLRTIVAGNFVPFSERSDQKLIYHFPRDRRDAIIS